MSESFAENRAKALNWISIGFVELFKATMILFIPTFLMIQIEGNVSFPISAILGVTNVYLYCFALPYPPLPTILPVPLGLIIWAALLSSRIMDSRVLLFTLATLLFLLGSFHQGDIPQVGLSLGGETVFLYYALVLLLAKYVKRLSSALKRNGRA